MALAPELEAARCVAEAIAARNTKGQRELHRQQLGRAIDLATQARDAATDERTRRRALLTLAKAHAVRVEDALHGAGQHSLSAQRAPTQEACDEGWRRVETIVEVAEASARAAAAIADELAAAGASADRARAAAAAARALVTHRNHAYTFHTDAAFSFGEGWYLAAAAALAGVAIQIEPGHPATAQAGCFLAEAGLTERLQPYRARPRAQKHLPAIVARAFRSDPIAAQAQLRAAFLGDAPIAASIRQWIDRRLAASASAGKVLLWIRRASHHPNRNTQLAEIDELARRARRAALVPVLIGDALGEGGLPKGAIDMTLFYKDRVFGGSDARRAQLQFFEHLKGAHRLVGQVGVTTAGMDGPALMGLPTLYLTDASNVRMRAWVGAIPGYEEIVRGDGYLERVGRSLRQWASADESGCDANGPALASQ